MCMRFVIQTNKFKRNVESRLIFLRHTSGTTCPWVILGSAYKYPRISTYSTLIFRGKEIKTSRIGRERKKKTVYDTARGNQRGEIRFSASPWWCFAGNNLLLKWLRRDGKSSDFLIRRKLDEKRRKDVPRENGFYSEKNNYLRLLRNWYPRRTKLRSF